MANLATRLQEELYKQRLSINAFAKRIGVSQQAISKIVKGETQNPKNILEIATALGVDPHWLKTGESATTLAAMQHEPDDEHYLRIDLYDYELAAGNGIINAEYPDVISSIWFTEEGLQQIVGRTSTAGICIFKVPTDSMEPTICPKDLVFIDHRVKSYMGEGVYAFRLNGEDYIKRLQRLPSGIIRALSDNPLYPPFDITEELFSQAEIIGKFIRVVPINPRNL